MKRPNPSDVAICGLIASCLFFAAPCWAELSKLEIRMGSSIQATVRLAEQDYFNGKFDSSGRNLRRALTNLG